MTLIKWILACLLIAIPASAQVDSIGISTANECGFGWLQNNEGTIAVSAYVTPDLANLQADSGRFGIGDDYDPPDSGVLCIYANSSAEPAALIAKSDTCGDNAHNDCDMLCVVYFGQEALPQDDTVWIGVFISDQTDRADIGLYETGTGIFYDVGLANIPNPWLTAGDAWQPGWQTSVRLYLSTAGAPAGIGQIIIISNVESDETPFYIGSTTGSEWKQHQQRYSGKGWNWTNENGYLHTCLIN